MQKIIEEINLEDRLMYWDDDDMEFLRVMGDDDEKRGPPGRFMQILLQKSF